MTKTFSAAILSTLFATIVFATASAATTTATVTAVGVATSSALQITKVVQPVLVSSTTASSCVPLMVSYNKIGSYGNEIAKLQNFLNNTNGANLNGQGYFGPVTQQEVKNFQYTYGIKPTGYQHVLTTKMINDINCGRVAVKQRKVYTANANTNTNSTTGQLVKVSPAGVNMNAINNNSKNLVKEYQVPKTINLIGTTSASASVTMATKTSFWENLNKDWNKIKENYKAYLLVFALVLALFWFLRKAATE